MKIKHRTPTVTPRDGGDIIDSAYEREVLAATARLERAYRRAEARLEAAIAKAERAQARAGTRDAAKVADLWAVVELRRLELDAYARQMATAPASAQHRGRDSYRPVPITHTAGL